MISFSLAHSRYVLQNAKFSVQLRPLPHIVEDGVFRQIRPVAITLPSSSTCRSRIAIISPSRTRQKCLLHCLLKHPALRAAWP